MEDDKNRMKKKNPIEAKLFLSSCGSTCGILCLLNSFKVKKAHFFVSPSLAVQHS